jgi:hypothetical protein
VSTQRTNRKRLTQNHIKRLDGLSFSWDPFSELWEKGFLALKAFHKREGHCHVAQKWIEAGFKLGTWVSGQRQKRSKLSSEQIDRLNSLGFIWNPIGNQWEDCFTALKEFQSREGHCRVGRDIFVNGFNLGSWVILQRSRQQQLTSIQLKRLNTLGFSWDPIEEQWEEAFDTLRKFRKREGHCSVPRSHLEDGLNLGNWVNKQRHKKAKLTPAKMKRLDSLGFIWKP